MAPNLAPLVNLVQGYVELGVKMLVFFFFFPYGFAFVGSNSYGDCGLVHTNDRLHVKGCCLHMHGGSRNMCVGFHVGGLIVSCGCFLWFGG